MAEAYNPLNIDTSLCVGCGTCVDVCPYNVLKLIDGKSTVLNASACVKCGACAASCPVNAITITGEKKEISKEEQDEIHRRMLGSEWENWDGKSHNVKIDAPKRLFIFYFLLLVLFNTVLLYGSFYLMKPRLDSFSAYLTYSVFALFSAYLFFIWIWFIIIILTTYTHIRFPFLHTKTGFLVNYVLNGVFKISKFFHRDKDRISNSFVKVGNSFIQATHKRQKQEKLLILLPRCLTGEVFKEVKKICNERNIELAIVEGGTLARKKIIDFRPTAIIGVACERDVVAGIRDVATKFSVLGVNNERPLGPCRNTIIDINVLNEKIDFFLGKDGMSIR
jgi:hypothetical protein